MLNHLQQQVLEATFSFMFSTLEEDVPPHIGLVVLKAIKKNTDYQQHITLLEQYQLLDTIHQIKDVYVHDCPQNRSTGSPYVQQRTGWVRFEPNGHGNGVVEERQGLLGLTALNDQATAAVTREDVITYLDQQIEACREKLEQRQLQVQQADQEVVASRLREERAQVSDLGSLMAFIQATVGFYDTFQHQIVDHARLHNNASLRENANQVAANYMTSVLNVLRKDAWESFLENSEHFAIPQFLKSFIVDYLKEHPILKAAKRYEQHTKQLEVAYLKEGNVNVANLVPNASIPQAVTPFWSSPSNTTSTIDIRAFTEAACALTEALKQKLADFHALDPNAANTYVSNLITAIRKNQVKDFFEDPQSFGMPSELKTLLESECRHHPILLQGQSLDVQQIKAVEVALVSQSLEEIRQSLGTTGGDSSNNNETLQAVPTTRFS